MKRDLTVSAVIPCFNNEILLGENLPKLIEAKKKSTNNIIEIIIVDNGSFDNSVNLVKTKFPEVKLIRHKINRGFSAAVNTGVRAAKGDLILLINTDVAPERDFLVSSLPHFRNSKVFAVSLHEEGYGSAKGNFVNGYIGLLMGPENDENHQTFYVSGGSGVFRRKVWMELGGMDEKLLSPFYWEDIDLCYRAAKRGYINLWEPMGKVIHKHESTINKLPKKYVERIRERNQLLMIWKNITSPALFQKHIIGIISRVIRHPGYIRILMMALGRLGTAIEKRKKETKESKVSDESIFARYV